nr:hypothetical protein [Paenibacillus bovis]
MSRFEWGVVVKWWVGIFYKTFGTKFCDETSIRTVLLDILTDVFIQIVH